MDKRTSIFNASKYLLEASKLLVDHEKVVSKMLLDLAKTLLDESFGSFSEEQSNQEDVSNSAKSVVEAVPVNEEILCNGHVNIDLTKENKQVEQQTQSKNQSCEINNKNSSCGINQNKVTDFMIRDIDTPEVSEIFEKIKAKLNKPKEELQDV
jgi:hypothetical protein